jgi:ZIP family zinc transporter
VLEAGFWGLVGGLALLVGALIGLYARASTRAIGLVMGFGAGVLISALAFELAAESFERGGTSPTVIGLAAGAVTFFVGDLIIDRRGGAHRKRSDGRQQDGAASAIVLGSLLDGIPESVAVGVSLLAGKGVGVAVVVAVFLSNIPESLSAATGLRTAGHSPRWILGLWSAVAGVSAIAAALGYALLGGASPSAVGVIQAFAGGAILTMLADTMLPEATESGGSVVGLATVLGFTLAFLLSHA